MTLAIPHAAAVGLLKTLKCSPVGLPKFSELPPDGWFHVVVVAAGGNMFASVELASSLQEGRHADHTESLPGSSEPAIVIQMAGWISDFRRSQEGKYLIMCFAMAMDASDYVYAPIVGWTDDFSVVSELFPQAKDKFLASFHGLPNVMLATIVKKSDTDDQMKAVFLEPFSLIGKAALQNEPFPGVQHDGISYLLTASPNMEPEEMECLRKLGDHIVLVKRCRTDGEDTGGEPVPKT
jgi:hypothetical protein